VTHASRALAALATLAALGFASISCEGDTMRRVRMSQYPPDFHYITEGEIRSTMGELAVNVVALDETLSQEGGPRPEERDEVIAILKRMRGLAGQLKKGSKSNHPRIDDNAPRLRHDIERALVRASATPPVYYDAGRLVGACTYCHVQRLTGRREL
jgi:hypothetical protein